MLRSAIHPDTLSTIRDAIRYAITDRFQLARNEPERRAALVSLVTRWADAGIDFIQLREKDLPAHELLQLCRELRDVLDTHNAPTRLLLNAGSDLSATAEIAVAARLDGLHLTSTWATHPNTPTLAELRARFTHLSPAKPATISISCHTIVEVAASSAAGVDLILFGPIFGKQVSGETIHPGVGLDLLTSACQAAAPTPILALGGITDANILSCLTAGAAGVAAIRLFTSTESAA